MILRYYWAQFWHTFGKRRKDSGFRINSAVDCLHSIGRLRPQAAILSVGCRNRYEPDLLEGAGWVVTAVDLFPMAPGIQRADMHKLPFADASFEAAVCSHVLEHAHDPDQALREIARVLRPNGLLWAAWPRGFVPNDHDRVDYGTAAQFYNRFPRQASPMWEEDQPTESRVLLRVW